MKNFCRCCSVLLFVLFVTFPFLISPAYAQFCIDVDGDGYGSPGDASCPNGPGTDCDDTDANVYPGATRICDGKDNNCDGRLDFSTDVDNDGDGFARCNDCNDSNPAVNPGAVEGPYGDATCTDGIDNDCDYLIDGLEMSCQSPCVDNDNDGYYSITASLPSCTFPLDDCNDDNAAIHPGAPDANCNNLDENCDGTPDDGYTATATNCGIGACASTGQLECQNGVIINTCMENPAGTEGPPGDATCSDVIDNDCDGQTDGADSDCIGCIPTGVPDDNCDAIDDDCDGTPDDEYLPTATSCGTGACASTGQLECQSGVLVDTCVENAPEIEGPLGDATCSDGADNDCDGATDAADQNCQVSCIDNDGDGYGNPGDPSCPNGAGTDCDDTDANVYPGATRICDGKDNNCDGRLDFSNDIDNDNDGFAQCAGDCNDNNPNVFPGAVEGPPDDATCFDALDNDCDGAADGTDSVGIPNCISWEGNCTTRTAPRNGPHMFDLMDPGVDPADPSDDTVIRTSCQWCHTDETGTINQQRECQRCHADPADTSDPLNGVLKDPSSPTGYPLSPPYGFGTAPNVKGHLYDASDPQIIPHCLTCHNPHLQEQDARYGTDFGMYIKEFICYDNPTTGLSAQELIELTATTGTGSYADGPPHNENICEMCHTQTNHHRRTGDAPGDLDSFGNYVGHSDGEWCIECHLHSDGFQPVARSPHNTPFFNQNCDLCHIDTQGVIDFAATVPDAKCRNCHGERTSHTSNPALNVLASGNYTYDVMCVDCHDPMTSVGNNRKLLRQVIPASVVPGSIVSNTTRRGSGSLADGPPRSENLCETCHFSTAHNRGDGTGGGIHADGINYDGFYCMICHDHNRSFMAPGKTCLEENEPGINCSP